MPSKEHKTRLRPSTRVLRVVALTVVILTIGIVLIVAALEATYVLSPLSTDPKSPLVLVIVPRGATDRQIGQILQSRGLIHDSAGFVLGARIEGVSGKMVAGTYEFSADMTPRAMAVAVALGRTAEDLVVIPEGFTERQIARRLAARHMVDEQQFLTLARTAGRTFDADGFVPPDNNLEGYLFPATYRIPRGTSERGIITMMLDKFRASVLPLDSALAAQPRRLKTIVTMASLVEREAGVDADRPKIAAALYNRLRIGMRLQCDATVDYGLPVYKTRLTDKDLKIDTPYNTYMHKGLPPTPIASPGIPSIEAALNPAHVGYLYYVARRDGSHTHIFSATLEEHYRAVAKVRATPPHS
jgi:UPF0755 protein